MTKVIQHSQYRSTRLLHNSLPRAVIALVLCLATTPATTSPLNDAAVAYSMGDYATALRLLRSLANEGNTLAQNNLGAMYASGQGVLKNDAEAARWYRLAADQGYAVAQNNLGVAYSEGRGVPKDEAKAVRWLRLAADQGLAKAQNNLGLMYMNGGGIPQNYSEAVKWLRKAADQGHAEGQNNLGLVYFWGWGVPQDYSEAVKWFRLAAEQGNADGQFDLGRMYNNGEGVSQSYREAAKWFRLAAAQNHSWAELMLGLYYAFGRDLHQDDVRAVKWYRLAAEQGHFEAEYRLGTMHLEGRGVPQDFVSAHMWFNLSAAQGEKSAATERDKLGARMLPLQIAEAQRMAREWSPKAPMGQSKDLKLLLEDADMDINNPFSIYGRAIRGPPTFKDGESAYRKGDYKTALRILRPLADGGFGPAQSILCMMYSNGEGLPQDYLLGHLWCNLSAAQGMETAAKNRDLAAKRMTPEQIAEALKMAREWMAKLETRPARP
jgi:uncharacterized protein